jgi:hypothetical protein
MKYDPYLVFQTHWGGGETQVYDIDNFVVVVNIFTGSALAVYPRPETGSVTEYIQQLPWACGHAGWTFATPPKAIITRGWSCRKSMEEAIEVNLTDAKNGGLVLLDVKVGDRVEFGIDAEVAHQGTVKSRIGNYLFIEEDRPVGAVGANWGTSVTDVTKIL